MARRWIAVTVFFCGCQWALPQIWHLSCEDHGWSCYLWVTNHWVSKKDLQRISLYLQSTGWDLPIQHSKKSGHMQNACYHITPGCIHLICQMLFVHWWPGLVHHTMTKSEWRHQNTWANKLLGIHFAKAGSWTEILHIWWCVVTFLENPDTGLEWWESGLHHCQRKCLECDHLSDNRHRSWCTCPFWYFSWDTIRRDLGTLGEDLLDLP